MGFYSKSGPTTQIKKECGNKPNNTNHCNVMSIKLSVIESTAGVLVIITQISWPKPHWSSWQITSTVKRSLLVWYHEHCGPLSMIIKGCSLQQRTDSLTLHVLYHITPRKLCKFKHAVPCLNIFWGKSEFSNHPPSTANTAAISTLKPQLNSFKFTSLKVMGCGVLKSSTGIQELKMKMYGRAAVLPVKY